jgi:hypothetical protein
MKNFLEILKNEFFGHLDPQPLQFNTLQLIRVKKSVREHLIECQRTGKVIGIYCPAIGTGMFLTGVDDIYNNGKEELVALKPYDMNGILLQRHHVALSEIRSICPFESYYTNPLIKKQNDMLVE